MKRPYKITNVHFNRNVTSPMSLKFNGIYFLKLHSKPFLQIEDLALPYAYQESFRLKQLETSDLNHLLSD
jgi:hypothetical protein